MSEAIEGDAALRVDATASGYRWIILAVVWVGYLVSFVDRLIWTNVSGSAANAFGLSFAAVGSFVSAFYAGYVVSTALTGLASDQFGARLTLSFALTFLGIFTFAFGFVTTPISGLILQGLMGLSAGADFSAGVKQIFGWFDARNRGRAMGLFMTATSLGVAIPNLMIPHLLNYISWRTLYEMAGVLTAVLGVVSYLLIRDNPRNGLFQRASWSDLRAALTTPQYIWVALAGMGGVWGTWGFAIWASALMTQGLQFPAATAGSIVATFGIVAIGGKPAIGLLSDWLGGKRKILVMVDLLLFGAVLLLTGAATSEIQLWCLAPILGLTAFVYSPLQNAMAAEAGGRAAGMAAGLSIALGSIATSVVPLAVGIGFEATRRFEVAFAILAIGPLLGALCRIPTRDLVHQRD